MFIKAENSCRMDFEIADPKVAKQLESVETKIPESLYSGFTQVPQVTSSKMLVVFKTLKKLRNWRSLALNRQQGQVREVLDILKIRMWKENKNRILSSNIEFLECVDE